MEAPRSILKKSGPTPSLPSSIPVPTTDLEKRRLESAVQHATVLQDQKNTQVQNLNAIEELSDFPSAEQSSETEAQRFIDLVTLFQPSDYDSLIEERHVNGRCGYTLCPKPPRKIDPLRSWKLEKGAENWCSRECARKALYVKAQLNETPAWERRGGSSQQISLKPSATDTAADRRNDAERASDQRHLALERGEKVSSTKIDQVLSIDVVEKATTATADALATVRFDDLIHDQIEGYQPKVKWRDQSTNS